jgi:GNAT superfamily N-acetyltransferase
MYLRPATSNDHPAVIALVNLAYRGDETSRGWNAESDVLEGERINLGALQRDLAAAPTAHLLLYCDTPDGPPLGTVWLEPEAKTELSGAWHLGLLSVDPRLQARQLGRGLLTAAEDFARDHGAKRIRMSVINVRDTLLAWYERRGYVPTGESEPYPYGDDRFGRPLRDDLLFLILEKAV